MADIFYSQEKQKLTLSAIKTHIVKVLPSRVPKEH